MGPVNDGNNAETYDISCPVCKTTKYRNPQMKLMVNVCGHALCDTCVKAIFTKESGQCPECDMVLKRTKYRVQLFEDPTVEKEIDIRRKVMRIYNKLEEDFETLEEFDDYLEEIEIIVYNLSNDINKLETEKKIEAYERLHKEEIKRNSIRRSTADEELIKIIEEEKLQVIQRQQQQKKEMEDVKKKQNNRNAILLKDLMASDGDAEAIVSSHAEKLRVEAEKQEQERLIAKLEAKQVNPAEFSSGVRIGYSGTNQKDSESVAAVKTMMAQIIDYSYLAPTIPSSFPIPDVDSLEPLGYIKHVRSVPNSGLAGGYNEQYACLKALSEFMTGKLI